MSKKILILASTSKRRADILSECKIRHKVIVSGMKEKFMPAAVISDIVKMNARLKAKKIAEKLNSGVILGVDTLVLLGKKLIGKPRNKKEARLFLKRFSGRKIDVYTGLYIIDKDRNKAIGGSEKSSLWVKRIRNDEIDKYLSHLGPFDKAGGFSIEGCGSIIFDNIKGSYFNILGLPMGKLSELLKRIGLDIFDFI